MFANPTMIRTEHLSMVSTSTLITICTSKTDAVISYGQVSGHTHLC